MTRPRIEAIRHLLTRTVGSGLAPGVVAGWLGMEDPTPRIVAVGRAVVAPGPEPVIEDTRFDLASLTKPLVVGTLSLLARRDGSLTLETTVADIIPETSGSPVARLTVRELLTHTSGLPAWEPIYGIAGGDPARAVESLMNLNPGPPGVHVVYSCPGFILLGKMLERLAGSGLDRIFADRVATPLGIGTEIGFRPPPSLPLAGGAGTPAAEELILKERGLPTDRIPTQSKGEPDDGNSRFLGGVAGNAGLFGTARGVLTLAGAYLGVGELLDPEEIALATANHTPGLETARGLAWQLATSPGCSAGSALDPTAFGHTGFTGSSLWVDPTRGLAVTLLANRVHPGHRPTDLHPLRRRFHQLVVDSLS